MLRVMQEAAERGPKFIALEMEFEEEWVYVNQIGEI